MEQGRYVASQWYEIKIDYEMAAVTVDKCLLYYRSPVSNIDYLPVNPLTDIVMCATKCTLYNINISSFVYFRLWSNDSAGDRCVATF